MNNHDLDAVSDLRARSHTELSRIFDEENKPNLQLLRVAGMTQFPKAIASANYPQVENVISESELKMNLETEDICQIYMIRQKRSWTYLCITSSLFKDLMELYNVFPPFWRFIFTFGCKLEDSNFEFPSFHYRYMKNCGVPKLIECAYILRRVELNHREPKEGIDHNPWSIRQSAVYQKYEPNVIRKTTFILVYPSSSSEEQLRRSIQANLSFDEVSEVFNLHRLLISDSLSNWQEYMAWLENQIKDLSDKVVVAKIGLEKETFSPLTNQEIDFTDRQRLKQLEDNIIDLEIIFDSLADSIEGVGKQSQRCCRTFCSSISQSCTCEQVKDELELCNRQIQMHIRRAGFLQGKARATSQLLADLLQYEDAVALKDMAHEVHNESISMRTLTEHSTRDAAAVKILTFITLVYLPTSIVASFFSTDFVKTNDSGEMRVSARAWLLAAIAIPLTLATIALWWIWVHFIINPKTPVESGQQSSPKPFTSSSPLLIFFPKTQKCGMDVENLPTSSPRTRPRKTSSFSFLAHSLFKARAGSWGSGKSRVSG